MSADDRVWYGRAGVGIGAIVLLLMAITGRDIPALSAVAVIAILVGLSLLISGITWPNGVAAGSTTSSCSEDDSGSA